MGVLYTEDEYLLHTKQITYQEYLNRINNKNKPILINKNKGLNADIFRYISYNAYDAQYKTLKPPSPWYVAPESDGYNLILVNDIDKQVIMGIRGTGGGENKGDTISNLYTDFNLLLGSETNTWRYNHSRTKLNQIFIDYPDYNINLTGHSLGAAVAETLDREYIDKINMVVCYGRPIGYNTFYTKRPTNLIDIISTADPISKGQFSVSGGYVIQKTGWQNPLTAHQKLITPDPYIENELNNILQKQV